MDVLEILKLLWPILVIQVCLQIFCIISVIRHGVANLNRWAWIIIIVLLELLGPVLFLTIGRNKGDKND